MTNKRIKQQLTQDRDSKHLHNIELQIKKASKIQLEKYHEAANKLQNILYGRIWVNRKQRKALLAELAKLPYICRGPHIKMYYLKNESKILN